MGHPNELPISCAHCLGKIVISLLIGYLNIVYFLHHSFQGGTKRVAHGTEAMQDLEGHTTHTGETGACYAAHAAATLFLRGKELFSSSG